MIRAILWRLLEPMVQAAIVERQRMIAAETQNLSAKMHEGLRRPGPSGSRLAQESDLVSAPRHPSSQQP